MDAGVGAIGGGGRYDGLMELEGGKPTPGVGFAVGFERIMLALAEQGIETDIAAPCCVYVATTSAEEAREAFSVVLALRGAGIRTKPIAQAALSKLSSNRQISWEQSFVWC